MFFGNNTLRQDWSILKTTGKLARMNKRKYRELSMDI
jgi:hypothetical protein